MALIDSLIAYWRLNEASGTRVDAHTGGLDLADNNTVTQATGHVTANAAQFTAANTEYLSHIDNADLKTGNVSWTFMTWVYPDDVSYRVILAKDDITNYEYWLATDPGYNNKIRAYMGLGGAADVTTVNAIPSGAWSLLFMYYNSSTAKLGVVIYGVETLEGSVSGTPTAGTASFRIGTDGRISIVPWNGRIGPVGFWKRVLTADERTALYNLGRGWDYPFVLPRHSLINFQDPGML